MIGMTGLIVDGGLMMASYRHASNAADAAAMAAALTLMRGGTGAQAIAQGTTFVTDGAHNALPNATVTINIPPSSGPYAGSNNYAEALVASPAPTYFIHVFPGQSNSTTVNGRAVAGFEAVAAGEGVITLNPNAKPGLKVSGGGSLIVEGDVLVNSTGGGEDENGNAVGNGQDGAMATNNSTVQAANILISGGVNDSDNFQSNPPGGPSPLDAGTGAFYPDPLICMDTPMVGTGVFNVDRGSPAASSGSLQLNNPMDANDVVGGGPNFIEYPGTANETMVLHPGIYASITITGGKVRFEPGIYVLRPVGNTVFILDITGGEVTANGVMFYNTGDNYDPVTGMPDAAERCQPNLTSPPPDDPEFGAIKINAGMNFQPLDATTYSPAGNDVTDFHNMLFYYRRTNGEVMQIEGNADDGNLAGTLYAPSAEVQISGQGTYDAQFIVGSMALTGQGDVTLNYNGAGVGKAPQVFLVE
jgi:hypothetical protein